MKIYFTTLNLKGHGQTWWGNNMDTLHLEEN